MVIRGGLWNASKRARHQIDQYDKQQGKVHCNADGNALDGIFQLLRQWQGLTLAMTDPVPGAGHGQEAN